MKLVVLVAAASLAACQGKARETPPAGGSAAPAGAGPAAAAAGSDAAPAKDLCWDSVAAIDRATCAAPDARQKLAPARAAIDQVAKTSGQIGGPRQEQFQVMCVQLLLAIERDAAAFGCTIAIDPAQRKEIDALLERWYAVRTRVAPTGNAAADAMIGRLAAVRDAACACRDAACIDALEPRLAGVGALPDAAPEAARTLARDLLDDTGRCAARARTLAAPAPAPAPAR